MSRIKGAFFIVFLALCLGSLGGFLYSRENLFRVAEIEVEGVDPVLEQRIESLVLPFYGRSLFSLKLSRLESQALSLPELESVRIMRIWPNRLRIAATPKRAVALEFINKELWLIDGDGTHFAKISTPLARPLLRNFRQNSQDRLKILSWLERQISNSFERGRVRDLDILDIDEIDFLKDGFFTARFHALDLEVLMQVKELNLAWHRVQRAHRSMLDKGVLPLEMDATGLTKIFIYRSRELQKSESGINLKELVRRTREKSPRAR